MADGNDGFSAAERKAMKQRAEELAAMNGVKGAAKKAKEYESCMAAIDALAGLDRTIAERFHVIVSEEAPHLDPKTWYGFPSYARDGKVVAFVQPASKFDTRYTTVGFNEDALLDDGEMWATSFAVVQWSQDVDERLRAVVRKAAG
jgi:uncharacterized protein YdhG (YjbR/CyaY superfamily)